MPRPPTPTQKRYRGRIRADMRSALRHIDFLLQWQAFYLTYPRNHYPNQLAPAADVVNLINAGNILTAWLASTGPIPDRGP